MTRAQLWASAAVAALIVPGIAAAQAPGSPAPPPSVAQGATGATAAPAPVFTPEDELILEVRTSKYVLTDGLTGYANPRGAYLPLGDFARLLDLAITVDARAGRAEGWFLDPKRTFRLDLASSTVEVAGRTLTLVSGDAVMSGGEIYVRAPLLAQWFPVDLKVNVAELSLRLETREPFPFEARMAREAARGSLGAARPGAPPRYPREPTPYLPLTVPALDVQARVSTGSQRDSRQSEYELRASGDLLWMGADLFVSGRQDKPLSGVRFSLSRRDPDGRIPLGPLHASEVGVGDVYSPSLPLASRSAFGRGAYVSTAPLDQPSIFQRIELRGELPLDNEVELYRNDVLIGSQSASTNGRYEFLDVPLEFGLNVTRLVFYGPRGERREEVRRIQVGGGRAPAGALRFSAGVVQQNTPLFGIFERAGRTPDDGAWRGALSLDYGLNSAVTLTAGLSSFSFLGERRNAVLGGLRTGFGEIALQADLGLQTDGSAALQLGAAGRAFGWSYALRHAEHTGRFADELLQDAGYYARRVTDLRLDGGVPIPRAKGGPLILATSLQSELGQGLDGRDFWRVALRNSAPVGPWLVSNTLDYLRNSSLGLSTQTLVGAAEANGRFGLWTLRTALGYELQPKPALRVLDVAVDRLLGTSTRFRADISQRLGEGSGTRVGVSVARLYRRFDVGLDAAYDTDRGFLVGLRVGFSLARDPFGGWRLSKPGLAQGGAVLAEVYRDLNGNGRRDVGEPGMPNVAFRGGIGPTVSDAQGRAWVTNLGQGRTAPVAIDPASMDDPYLAPSREGIEIAPRPGRTHVAGFPVVAVAEVEGEVRFTGPEGDRPVSSVSLQLVGPDGQVAGAQRTAYDGYVLFEKVKPGTYRLQLDPEQSARLKIGLEPVAAVVVPPEGGVVKLGVLRVRSRPGS